MRTIASTGLSLGLASMASAVMYGYNHVPVVPDTEIVAGAFENVNNVKLLSPAFVTPNARLPGFPNGTQGSSSQNDMEAFLEQLADRNDYMTYRTANFTSEEGRSFPYVHLSASRSSSLRRDGSASKVRVWIQGAVHGNEPAGDEATLALLGKFDEDQEWAASILDERTLATNYDPNRDHIKLARQQTRDIKQLMNNFNPHVVVDMHEYGAPSRFGEGQYVHGSDGLYSAAKNLNINERIRNLAEELFAKNIGEDMEAVGLRAEPYVTGSSASGSEFVADFAEAGTDGKIGRNAMGLTQAVVFLLEMRGIAIADQEFQRRTAAGLTMLGSIVQTAADNADQVFKTVEDGIKEFIASDGDIILTDYSKTEIRPFTMVDVKNGSVVYPPVRFASTTPAVANLTRSRPEAYLIPVAWADLAKRLEVLVDTSYYEGVIRVTATTEASERELRLSKGSFRVSTRQKNAALAMVALEPENIDSYVSFNIVPVKKSDEYPIYRIMS
ncbi:carboxypeptidase 2 [Aspergillus bombycis]|uniref:Carboxypeptidase 2 n=1 Tax=Aspergillus bombycis TaxID=109264 RepID=A0A1F7ZRD0_9EURO|nr:carboxypeptidase 2 [Aspergillus bombycis]OGM41839.1 carboxypeptidase 2 [Aspergillus bombycis]